MSTNNPSDYSQPENQNYYANNQPLPPKKGFNIFGLTWDKNYVAAPPLAAPKNVVLAYVLWFFFGVFGVHQYYLGNNKRGLLMLAGWGLAVVTSFIFVGYIVGLAVTAYWIYEAVTLYDQVNEINSGRMRQSIL